MKKIIYSLLATLMMMCAVECSAQTVSGSKGGHDYVDLGLPSGILWATCNVGATEPTEYGDYFAWGETKPKEDYSWDTYNGKKHSWDSNKGKDDVDDSFAKEYTTYDLMSSSDAVTANWGSPWRMPTRDEQKELLEGCTWTWTNNFKGSGIAGQIGKSKNNGNTIFLPAAGHCRDTDLNLVGEEGLYWSATINEFHTDKACNLGFYSDYIDLDYNYFRHIGGSVRAVVK